MATNDSVNASLNGNNGTGKFVGANTPTLVTPTIGVATGTSIAFSPDTNGIIGTTAGDTSTAGYVGETISSVILYASRITFTTSSTTQNLTSISLTAGDWDVWGNIYFVPSAGMQPYTAYSAITTTSATLPDRSLWTTVSSTNWTAGAAIGLVTPQQRFNVSTNTTVYLAGFINWTGGTTMTFCGGLYAERAR